MADTLCVPKNVRRILIGKTGQIGIVVEINYQPTDKLLLVLVVKTQVDGVTCFLGNCAFGQGRTDKSRCSLNPQPRLHTKELCSLLHR